MIINLWNDAEKHLERTVDTHSPFSGKLIELYLDEVALPDGSTSTREWIRHPGACAVVPVFSDGTIMLVKQFRYPLKQIFYEVPAGKIDPGEAPDTTAARETREETGLQAASLGYAGHFYPVIGYSDEIIHIYVAWNLEQLSRKYDEDEFLVNVRVPFNEALQMIEKGEITDGKTICSLMKARIWWEKHKPFEVAFNG